MVPAPTDYIGRTVVIDGKDVVIETITGNLGRSLGRGDKMSPMFYEINGEHLMNMLRFHAQMEGATDITEEQFIAFEQMEIEAEKLPETVLPAEEARERVARSKGIDPSLFGIEVAKESIWKGESGPTWTWDESGFKVEGESHGSQKEQD